MIVKVRAIIAQSTQKLMEFRGQGNQGGKLHTGALLTAQMYAIALLGHTNYELSLRRREAIKPNLINKEYSSLCSSQSQLTAIRASNCISHTAVHNSSISSTSQYPKVNTDRFKNSYINRLIFKYNLAM